MTTVVHRPPGALSPPSGVMIIGRRAGMQMGRRRCDGVLKIDCRLWA